MRSLDTKDTSACFTSIAWLLTWRFLGNCPICMQRCMKSTPFISSTCTKGAVSERDLSLMCKRFSGVRLLYRSMSKSVTVFASIVGKVPGETLPRSNFQLRRCHCCGKSITSRNLLSRTSLFWVQERECVLPRFSLCSVGDLVMLGANHAIKVYGV
jgi:hypothetical protein